MVLSSFKTTTEIFVSPWKIPESLRFINYIDAWKQYNIGHSFINSLFVTMLSSVINLFFSLTTSYAIEKIRFRGNQILINVYLAAMMIPAALGWIPLFFLLNNFHLLNNLIMLSFVYAVGKLPFSTIIISSFMDSVPRELEEAAAIDGLSNFGILFRIVVPILRPAVITVTVMNVIAFWSEYFMAMLFIQNEDRMTLGVAMDLMNRNAQYKNAWGALFAGLSITTIPIVILYALMQKYIVKGMAEGAVKG
jgi:N-acetylglucosamine transport system permease protein